MVTETRPRLADELTQVLTQEQTEVQTEALPMPGVREVGERIGIPVVIRPWWGSRRQYARRVHSKCGQTLWHRENWCSTCSCFVHPGEIETVHDQPRRWVCPGRDTYQEIKWPAIEKDTVVMWEGPCKASRRGKVHKHSQTLQVLDFSDVAMLVRVSVGSHRLNFLIGRDDGHPFVTVVTRNQVTVSQAYDYLVPKPVWEAQMHGFNVPRQGDWFFVPREFWTPRPVRESRARPWPGRMGATMVYPDYGVVYSWAPLDSTRHLAERVIFTCGPGPLVKGCVTAPDHPDLQLETWHVAIRNRRPPAFNPDSRGDDD